jgi:4-hydroxymandelate oxidase
MHVTRLTRRQAMNAVVGTVAASAGLAGAQTPGPAAVAGPRPHAAGSVRLAPRADLVNTLEFEEQARRILPAAAARELEGGVRHAFDRMTLRPRVMVPMLDLDLSSTLFNVPMFAPIIVAPIANQQQFHPEGELATLRGAAAAQTVVISSSRSGIPFADRRTASSPFWFQVFAGDAGAQAQAQQAIASGCELLCVTVGVAPGSDGRLRLTSARRDWNAVAALRKIAGNLPVVVKGITSPDTASRALDAGAHGMVVSSYSGQPDPGGNAVILSLPPIVETVAGRVPVLIDGSFRRGTDILKALALGARAVLVGRPVMWGLAAYGADGVQGVLEMLQTELARYMAMSGRSSLAALDRSLVRIHAARVEGRDAGA